MGASPEDNTAKPTPRPLFWGSERVWVPAREPLTARAALPHVVALSYLSALAGAFWAVCPIHWVRTLAMGCLAAIVGAHVATDERLPGAYGLQAGVAVALLGVTAMALSVASAMGGNA